MPRIIFKCRYLKNAAEHLKNLVVYVATREGVEKIPPRSRTLPAAKKQQQLIEDILERFPDATDLCEYEDYLKQPTVENASAFISTALDQNLDRFRQEVYVNYIATRPARAGDHGSVPTMTLPGIVKGGGGSRGYAGSVWTPIIPCGGRTPPGWATITPPHGWRSA